jgi:hypothetical protein
MEVGLRGFCYGLSPLQRLITILVFCVLLGMMSIYMTVSSIYNIGKRDAQKEFLEVEHLQELNLSSTNDSINLLKQ